MSEWRISLAVYPSVPVHLSGQVPGRRENHLSQIVFKERHQRSGAPACSPLTSSSRRDKRHTPKGCRHSPSSKSTQVVAAQRAALTLIVRLAILAALVLASSLATNRSISTGSPRAREKGWVVLPRSGPRRRIFAKVSKTITPPFLPPDFVSPINLPRSWPRCTRAASNSK